MRYLNRYKELDFLKREYNKNEASLIILYGRRRIGKTALATEFIKDKEALYYLATEESEDINRRLFKDVVADYIGNDILKSATIDKWDLIFQALSEFRPYEKKVIILDEFQYLGKSNPAFPSIFQRIWDTILRNKKFMVILCGSLISMMESQTLNYSSPLYGRRTGQIELQQIPFTYYKDFFPDKSRKGLIELYSVTGGVPKYIELFYNNRDLFGGIKNNILNKSSFLFEEPRYLLMNEVSEIGSYFSIIKTIAAGNHKLSKIAGSIGLKQTGITKYLKTLIDLDILVREVPITEDLPEKSKKGLYRIKDNFINFWFKFIYPNLSFIEQGYEALVEMIIKNNIIDNHVSYVYENICKEEMWEFNKEGKWSFHFNKVGRWWDKDTEIDIVALDTENNNIIFGECKYTDKKMDVNIFNSLLLKANKVSWRRNVRKEWFVLFSINGYTDELQDLAQKRKDLLLR
ncbi:MAG: ATP-binding protein [Clostridiales bacterium]|nr:ATP-binding protein [Clostridiales bacterium]